jgi:hypothetical protein
VDEGEGEDAMNEEPACTWLEKLSEFCGDSLAGALCPASRVGDDWTPVDQDTALAWTMYTELRTRIATQPLPLRDGIEATALKSLVDLFGLARVALRERPQAQHAASLVTHCLNTHVRPFTARWHPKSEFGALASLDQRFAFRSELIRVQRLLRGLASVLGQICGDKDAREFLKPLPRELENPDTRRGRLPYGIATAGQPAVICAMNAAERDLLHLRRDVDPTKTAELVHDAVGLAMSGGGIRSATFSLGVVQVLARRGILKNVDVMSTVSGGGYLGTFITSVLNSADAEVGLEAGKQPFADIGNIESSPIRYLRNHSKYLSEGGIATLALMVFSAAYGVAMSVLLVVPFLLGLAMVAVYVFGAGPPGSQSLISVSPKLLSWIVWPMLAAIVIVLSVMRNPSGTAHKYLQHAAILLLFGGLAIWCAQGLNSVYGITSGHPLVFLGAVLLLPIFLGVAGLWWGSTILGRVAWSLLAVMGPILFLALWLLAVALAVSMREQSEYLPWIVLTTVLIHAAVGVNINFASLHLYYRDRLARTYMRRVNSMDAVDPQPLSTINPHHKAPLHLINAAVNLPASKNPDLRGRNTDFFIFAKHYCGGPTVGLWPTADWEAKDSHLDLGTAMAISGAAAAPRMGTLTSAKYTTLMAMLNVRLGYWLRRPDSVGPLSGVPGASYFLRELTGRMDESLPFLNLSDGGHIENIGIYELLRRRCRYIIAIDGEADPNHTFGGLLTAIQMAKIDLGVRIDPDLSDLRDGVEHFKRAHFVMTRIDYGVSDASGPILGLLLVIKLALTGNESELLMRYRQENPAFPHQSTAQQLFNESQFEAYRALGEHAAEAAFDPLLVETPPGQAFVWMRELEQRLLPIPDASAAETARSLY